MPRAWKQMVCPGISSSGVTPHMGHIQNNISARRRSAKKTVAELIWQDEENEQRGEWVDVNTDPWDRVRELDWKANDQWFNFDSRFY